MAYLLDTNILSELQRFNPHPGVIAWYSTVSSAELYLSSLSVGEIARGIENLVSRDAARAATLQRWLDGLVASYGDRVIGVDISVAIEWGRLSAGRSLPIVDSLIAATAKVHNWTVVTRNVKDMRDTGARLLNPYDWPVS